MFESTVTKPKEEETQIATSRRGFDSEDIETWFVCLEAAFYVNGVKLDRHKFKAVIVALGTRAKFFHSAIAKCNKSETSVRYDTMKQAVIQCFRPTENQRLTSLLSGVSLGDRKPSALLSEMRRLGEEGCFDNVLTNIWLRALPITARSIIAAMPSASLDDQAKVADKILEAPSSTPPSTSDTSAVACATINTLEARIEALSRRLDEAATRIRIEATMGPKNSKFIAITHTIESTAPKSHKSHNTHHDTTNSTNSPSHPSTTHHEKNTSIKLNHMILNEN
uniref:DUF7041 domain-containing protein n=1 Tax=Anopheles funestus TaxID=62324 RepID=A0A182S003_ANOFN